MAVGSGSASQADITGRQAHRMYTVSMVALSALLPNVKTTPVPAVRLGMKFQIYVIIITIILDGLSICVGLSQSGIQRLLTGSCNISLA